MYSYKDDMYCECSDERMSVMPENPVLATAYVPFQHAKCMYNAAKGLSQGSIFPELVMPYESPFKSGCGCGESNQENMCCCECKEDYCL